jgi:hypothetical protein
MLTADRLIRSVVLFVTSGLRCLLAVSIQLVSSSFCFYILVPALSTLIAGCVSHSFLKKFGQVGFLGFRSELCGGSSNFWSSWLEQQCMAGQSLVMQPICVNLPGFGCFRLHWFLPDDLTFWPHESLPLKFCHH